MNPKGIIGAAIVGFVLSFFTGLISGAFILIVLLRAFIFAIVFGALGFFVPFVCGRFLDVGAAEPAPVAESGGSEVHIRRPGGTIDISIGEDELPREENEPHFYVSPSSPQNFVGEPLVKTTKAAPVQPAAAQAPVTPQPVQPSQPVAATTDAAPVSEAAQPIQEEQEQKEEPQEFIPVALGSTPAQESGNTPDKQEVKKDTNPRLSAKKAAAAAAAAQQKADLAQLDQLPDMDGFAADDAGAGSGGEDASPAEILQEADVPESRGSSSAIDSSLATSTRSSAGADAEIMAKAISTILSNEN